MIPAKLRPVAASAFERLIENRILICEDLYDLDTETVLRRRDGRVETGTPDSFEREAWS